MFRPSRSIYSLQLRTCELRYNARRLSSSQVDPQTILTCKREQEARDRGEFIDIHDVGGMDPANYHVRITDVGDAKLRTEISGIGNTIV